jgi:hypothetical protein
MASADAAAVKLLCSAALRNVERWGSSEMPGIRVDCNVYPPAISTGATAALIGSIMANAENSAVASVRSSISASRSPSAEIF